MTNYKYVNKELKNKIDKLDPIAYERFKQGESITSIAKDFKMDRGRLSKRLKEKYNISILPNGKKSINSSYFSVLNHENAYWLGLILADGCINDKTNSFEITLKDKEHIELFKQHISSSHKIGTKVVHGKSYYRISFNDKQIIHDLMSYGVIRNKTYVDFSLPNIPDVFFNDFFRGIIDGDGMYYVSPSNKSRFHIYISVSFSCQTYTKELQEKIQKFYGVNVKLYKQRTCYQLAIFKKDSVKIAKQLYDNTNLFLERKYEKCIDFI